MRKIEYRISIFLKYRYLSKISIYRISLIQASDLAKRLHNNVLVILQKDRRLELRISESVICAFSKEILLNKLVLLSNIFLYLHSSMTLNNEKNCQKISKDKIAICEKTAGLQYEADLNSACLKVLAFVKIFQFLDM